MEDERYTLDNWQRMNIFPKEKIHTVAQLVSETILSLRWYLIDQKVKDYQQEALANIADVNKNILEEVKDYSGLKMLLSRKLNRVLWFGVKLCLTNQINQISNFKLTH